MIKNFQEFSLNENNNTCYTTSRPQTIKQFIEIEVDERENYTIEDVNGWIEKYQIKSDDKILWVTNEPYLAARYQMSSDDWDNAKKVYKKHPEDFNVREINSSDCTAIPESDDGDGGFIVLLKNKNHKL